MNTNMLAIFLAFVQATSADRPLYPHLAAEINEMTRVDQAIRNKWIGASTVKGADLKAIVDQMTAIDHEDTVRMKWIVSEFGWPTPAMVGAEASSNAWLLVQHADADLPFQKRCLTLIEPLANNKTIEGRFYAYLFDRVQVGSGKLQRYGTQGKVEEGLAWIQPVDDPARVDTYRKSMGLESLETYLKGLAEVYKAKIAPDWRARLVLPNKSRNRPLQS